MTLHELILELSAVKTWLETATGDGSQVTAMPISKAAAVCLLATDTLPPHVVVMCKEYGADSDPDYWSGMEKGDLEDGTIFDDDYKTFELWMVRRKR